MGKKHLKSKKSEKSKSDKTKDDVKPSEPVVTSVVERTMTATMEDSTYKKNDHRFWKNKPVPDYNENSFKCETIEKLMEREIYKQEEPLKVPVNFSWDEFSGVDDEKVLELSFFLNLNYEVDNSLFYSHFTPQFLQWSLGKTHKNGSFLVLRKDGNICGSIGTIYKTMTVFDKTETTVEFNFACVVPELRKKNMLCVMIDEMIRRTLQHLKSTDTEINFGFFMTQNMVPSPVAEINYYHRPLSVLKLSDLKFVDLGEKDFEPKIQFYSSVDPIRPDFVAALPEHYETIYNLYNTTTKTFNVYQNFSFDEFKYFMFDNQFMKTYVYLNKDKEVVDFGSVNIKTLNVAGKKEVIRVGLVHFYSANVLAPETTVSYLISVCKYLKMDCVELTDTMWNRDFLMIDPLLTDVYTQKKFGMKFLKPVDNHMSKKNLNFFNLTCPKMKSNQLMSF